MKAATAAAAGESGLLTVGGQPVPLVGVHVEAEIRDYGARVVVSQRYRNDEAQPIEAVYKFPLEEGVAVCGFEAEVEGRRVVGKVEGREKAFETYDEAMAAGHGAYLVDQERPDIFTVSVGNVPPGKEVVLRITTVSELTLEGDAIRFTLPTTISPRYAPAEDQKGVGITEAERVSPPYALAVPYGLTLKVDVETSARIRSVDSTTHPIRASYEGCHAVVELSTRETAMDRDLVLTIALEEENQPRALVERAPDGRAYALVSFRPKLGTESAASEVVFLVDRSGSMDGPSIVEARKALELALRSLRPGCYFNIVGFGSSHSALFPESRPYDSASLGEASSHVRSMRADLGGTEILPALEFVLGTKARAGLPRQIFVVTDGEVSNTDAVIELVRQHGADTRVFAFGIGASPSRHLVKGLARAGEGEAEFIAPGERIDEKVLRQLGRALSAALTDVRVDWGGLDVEQSPYVVPPVFADGRVVVFGRTKEPKATTVTLRGKSAQGEVAFSAPVDLSAAREGTLVSTLWARRAIRDLEEGCSRLHTERGSKQQRGAASLATRVEAEIVRLGLEHQLVSRHTSFVAVEERETPVSGEVKLRKVPVAISSGWHGIGSALDLGTACQVCYSLADSFSEATAAPRPAPPAEERESLRVQHPLERVLSLHCADGSWDLTPGLAAGLGVPRAKVERAFEEAFESLVSGWDRIGAVAQLAEGILRALRDLRDLPDGLDELVHRMRADLRGLGEPIPAMSAEIENQQNALRAPTQRLQAVLEDLLAHLGRVRVGGPDPHACRRAFATALALRWLEARAADARGEWEWVAQKGHEWLHRMPPGREFWLEAVDGAQLLEGPGV